MVRRSRNASSKHQTGEPVEVILLNPDGTPLVCRAERPPDENGPKSDVLPDLGAATVATIRHLRQMTAAPGPRAGGSGDRVTRQGSEEEIMTPIGVSPDVAATTMADGRFFRAPPTGLVVDPASLEVDRTGLRWRATLRTGPVSSRAANLRLYSSPSRNIAVLELIPEARRFIRTRSFVRRGVPAIAELAERLDRLAAATPTV